MAKIGRNQPCPCGSGRKYKRCCWDRDRAARVPATPAVSPHGYHLAETDLDRLSNSVVSLVDEGRLDEADAACEQLRTRYPEVHDWLMRKAMDGVFAIIGEALADGEDVRLPGFGTFGTRSRPARTGRNPRTGESVSISASTLPTFKAGKTLKDSVNGGPGS